jgi:predicted DNA-binding protein
MGSNSKPAFATRLPAEHADLAEAAIDETDTTKADFLRRAVEYYIRRNPDHFSSLYSDESVHGIIRDLKATDNE